MTKHVLSIDGGGLRGLIAAVWLEELEKRLEKAEMQKNPDAWSSDRRVLREKFDFFVGASTGSILAMGIAAGMKASELKEMYLKHAAVIFPHKTRLAKFWSKIRKPSYKRKGLDETLKKCFRKSDGSLLTLGDLGKPVMISTYNMLGSRPLLLKSWHEAYKYLNVWEVSAASSSGPTYFAPYEMAVEKNSTCLVDGGVVANNMAAYGLVEAMSGKAFVPYQDGKFIIAPQALERHSVKVLSVGTGTAVDYLQADKVARWGAICWVWKKTIIDILFDGNSESMDYMVKSLIPAEHYVRLQCKLSKRLSAMDNSKRRHLLKLENKALDSIATHEFQENLDRVVSWF